MHASILPSDEVIYERSKVWSNFLSRMIRKETFESILYGEIPSGTEEDDESESGADENVATNNCKAMVHVNNFEGSSSSDQFDVEDLMNETLPAIEARKLKWKESGMDRILDTFDVNVITDKVGSWLRKTRMEKSMASNTSMEDAQFVHFEDHQIQFNSDDSLQSADTAKYILSNRKPKSASCTTMTIKRFRYVKGKQKELQRKYNYLKEFDENQEFDEVFRKTREAYIPRINERTRARAMSEDVVRPMASSHSSKYRNKSCKECINDSFSKAIEPKHETLRRQKSRKRRSEISRKRSVSSSSSSSSSSICFSTNRKPKPRIFRVKSKRYSASDRTAEIPHSLDSELGQKRIASPVKTLNEQANPLTKLKARQTEQISNDTCFLPDNIVNSTAVSNSKANHPIKPKNCMLSPIVNKISKRKPLIKLRRLFKDCENTKKCQVEEKVVEVPRESVQPTNIPRTQNSDRKILVYSPQKKDMCRESISGGSFKLTEEHLRKSIGEKAARRFIKFNAREFPWEFNSTSTIYFKLPTESENSHRSGSSGDSDEEDILNMFGKQGELVEHPINES